MTGTSNQPLMTMPGIHHYALPLFLSALPLTACAQSSALNQPPTPDCSSCEEWNVERAPFRLFGNTYYVGTDGLGAILVTSDAGHVLIDGALPESAAQIFANIERLGFDGDDVELILNSHAHFDHAGGIGLLQQATGATVAASPSGARALEAGNSGPDDPQYGVLLPFPPSRDVRVVQDGETLRVGELAMTVLFTPGHTPGGTSWSWRSCEGDRCLDFVYADSQTPISADGFFYTRSTAYPNAIADFEKGFAALERVSCDVLLTPHPSASSLWERVARRDAGEADALVDRDACRRYAAGARQQLERRIATENAAR